MWTSDLFSLLEFQIKKLSRPKSIVAFTSGKQKYSRKLITKINNMRHLLNTYFVVKPIFDITKVSLSQPDEENSTNTELKFYLKDAYLLISRKTRNSTTTYIST